MRIKELASTICLTACDNQAQFEKAGSVFFYMLGAETVLRELKRQEIVSSRQYDQVMKELCRFGWGEVE